MLHRFLTGLCVLIACMAITAAARAQDHTPVRVVQVDLDYVYDADPEQTSHNIDQLVARIASMKINMVFLQAFADPQGTGLASALYFPNRQLPMRADLFHRVAEQLQSRAGVKVFGWLPVLSFDFSGTVSPVMAWNGMTGTAAPDPKAYKRASVFEFAARQRILDIYEDLARTGALDGLLFHDDAMLSDFEDASPPALLAYVRAGFPPSINEIRGSPAVMARWTDFKVDTLISFTHDLVSRARLYLPRLMTARNIYAMPVLNPGSREWFAQDYDRFLQAYDYTAIEAMPQMENIPDDDAQDWIQKIISEVAKRPEGLNHTIFELQAVDWRKKDKEGANRAVPSDQLASEMRMLKDNGVANFGYYPDDFVTNTPDVQILRPAFSLQP